MNMPTEMVQILIHAFKSAEDFLVAVFGVFLQSR